MIKTIKTCAAIASATLATLLFASASFAVDNNSTRIGPYKEWHEELIIIGNGFNTNGHTALGFTYGLGPDKSTFLGRSEIGMDFVLSAGPFAGVSIPSNSSPTDLQGLPTLFSGDTLSPLQRVFWGAKTQLYEDPKTMTRVALGGYLWGAPEAHAADLGFLALSRQYKWGYAHIGVIHSFAGAANIRTPAGHDDHTFWQLDYAKVVRPRLVAGFNFYSGRSNESAFFPAVIYFLSDDYNSSMTLGDFHFNDSSVKPTQDQLYFQFDYYWNGPSHVRRMMPPPPAPKPEAAPAPAPPTINTAPPQAPAPATPQNPTAPAPPAPAGGGQ